FPSHTAILTSHAPFEWHVFNNGDVFNTKILENHSPLLTDDMRKAGYETGAFVSLAILKSNFGLNHGFQTYQDDFGRIRWYRVASEMNDSAIPWIEKQSKNHFFAWIHYSDPHEPYITVDAPPDTEVSINGDEPNRFCIAKKELNFFRFEALPGKNVIDLRTVDSNSPHLIDRFLLKPEKDLEIVYGDGWKERPRPNGKPEKYFDNSSQITILNKNPKPVHVTLTLRGDIDQSIAVTRTNYRAEVQYADKYIGILWNKLQQLGLLNNTIIVITGDHGEGLGNHTRIGHLFPLYREITQVPLIIYYPHLGRSGHKVTRLVNHLDVKPTILDLVHLKSDTPMEGE